MIRRILLAALLVFAAVLTACAPKEQITPHPKKREIQPKETHPSFSILETTWRSAQKGMISESPVNVVDGVFNEIEAEWGEPDKVDQAGFGSYATYQSRNASVGFHSSGEVFDLRSFNEDLHRITTELLTKTYGTPAEIREANNEKIYVYQVTKNIELKVIIPNGQNTVDHISVFNPERAKKGYEGAATPYFLDIKGQSNQLSALAWEKMQNWRKQVVLFSKKHDQVYINGPDEKRVALTFDDGPDNRVTPAIIDILKEYGVKGNFFFLGNAVENYPDVVKKTYDQGHLVLSHSYLHREQTKLGEEQLRKEIDRAGKAIKSVTGKEPAMIRPPFGETNARTAGVLKSEGYSIVMWSIDTLDWSQKESGSIIKNVTGNVRNGDIILMHSDGDKTQTAKALPAIIEALKNKGYEIVDLETLLGVKAYR